LFLAYIHAISSEGKTSEKMGKGVDEKKKKKEREVRDKR